MRRPPTSLPRFALACFLLGTLSCAPAPADGDEVLDVGPETTVDEAVASDNVEIKVTVRTDQITATLARLRLTTASAEQRAVTFYDTRALDLFNNGIVLRSRRVTDGPDDSTVKLRPMDRASVDASWLRRSGFKCETDLVGTRSVDSCSYTVGQDRGEIDEVAAGRRDIDQLYSREQEGYVAQYGRRRFVWSDLSVLGPVRALVWRVRGRAFRSDITAELWTLPDGRRLLELSTRVPRAASVATARDFAVYLRALGVDPSDAQETKTRVALEYFASRR